MKIFFKIFAICMLLLTTIFAVSAIQFKPSGNIQMELYNLTNATNIKSVNINSTNGYITNAYTTSCYATTLNSSSSTYSYADFIRQTDSTAPYNSKGYSIKFGTKTYATFQSGIESNTTNAEYGMAKFQVMQKGATNDVLQIYPSGNNVRLYLKTINTSNVTRNAGYLEIVMTNNVGELVWYITNASNNDNERFRINNSGVYYTNRTGGKIVIASG